MVLESIYKAMEAEPIVSALPAKVSLAREALQLHKFYNVLSTAALDSGRKGYKIMPKLHLLLHLFDWQVREPGLNPRSYWCYAEDDLVGSLVEIAQSCHALKLAPIATTKWTIIGLAQKNH